MASVYASALFLVAACRSGSIPLLLQIAWVAVPLIWIAATAAMTAVTKTPPHAFGITAAGWRHGLKEAGLASLFLFPPFAAGYLLYHTTFLNQTFRFHLPDGFLAVSFYQLVYVGLSEELFFRGYLQSRLDQIFPPFVQIRGVLVGGGLIAASLLFAVGHFWIDGSWTRLSVFFPSLVFGWLRAGTGSVLAPALFHGLSNILLWVLRKGLSA